MLAELDRIPAGSLSAVSQSMLDWLRASSLNHLGRLNEGLSAAEAALAPASPLIAPMVETARLQAMWYAGRVDVVLDRLPALLDATAAIGQRDYTALLASTCCLAFAADGRLDEAEQQLARRVAATPDTPLVDVNRAIATAAVAGARGDEATAAQALDEHLQRAPGDVLTGLAAYPRHRSLVLWHVLVPPSRPACEAASLGPCYDVARDLARRVVTARSDHPAALPDAPLPEPDIVRSVVPLPWISELALAHIDAGRQDGWTLLDAVWPRARPDVRRHAAGQDRSAPLGRPGRPARAALARLLVPPAGRLELRLLGHVELARDGQLMEAPEWRRERVRALLAVPKPTSEAHYDDAAPGDEGPPTGRESTVAADPAPVPTIPCPRHTAIHTSITPARGTQINGSGRTQQERRTGDVERPWDSAGVDEMGDLLAASDATSGDAA